MINKYLNRKYYKIYEFDREVVASFFMLLIFLVINLIIRSEISLIITIFISLPLFAIVLTYTLYQPFTYRIKQTKCYLDINSNKILKKPKGEKVARIIFITDVHLHEFTPKKFIPRLIQEINTLKPDIVLFGGDYVVDSYTDFNLLKSLQTIDAKYKIGILGNHDYDIQGKEYGQGLVDKRNYDFADNLTNTLSKYQIQILRNDNQVLDLNGAKINIYGLDEVWAQKTAFDNYKPQDVNILLVHNPKVFQEIDLVDVHLVLAGHNHGGGQAKLGKYISLHRMYMLLPDFISKWAKAGFNNMVSGFYRNKSGINLYLSRGIGTTGLGVRINCPPEIVVIDLVSG